MCGRARTRSQRPLSRPRGARSRQAHDGDFVSVTSVMDIMRQNALNLKMLFQAIVPAIGREDWTATLAANEQTLRDFIIPPS